MNRASRPLLAAAVAGILLFGVSCAQSTPDANPAASSPAAGSGSATVAPGATTPETVAWTDKVCGALRTFTQVAGSPPQLATTSIQASVQSLTDYVGKLSASVDGTIDGLKAAGPSPAPDGDAIVTQMTDGFARYRQLFEQIKTNIATDKPADQPSLQKAIAPLADIKNLPNPATVLRSSPTVAAAADQAPNCQAFRAPATPQPTAQPTG
jgi:hypothetical protein